MSSQRSYFGEKGKDQWKDGFTFSGEALPAELPMSFQSFNSSSTLDTNLSRDNQF